MATAANVPPEMTRPTLLSPDPPTSLATDASESRSITTNCRLEGVSNTVTESAGARVASTYELFSKICRLLLVDGRPSPLLNPATACRAMSDVALDILWEKQVHLGYLFLTMARVEKIQVTRRRWVNVSSYNCPPGNRKISPREVSKTLLKLPQEGRRAVVTEAEYARFRSYAQRIKILVDFKDKEYAYIIIDRPLLRAVLKHGPILPNAHTINFRSSEKYAFEGLHIVLQSDSTMTARGRSHDAWVSLARRYFDSSTTSFKYRAIAACASLSNIRALTISPGEEYAAIPHLRGLPFLEELHLIDFVSCIFSRSEPLPTPQPGFRALRSLKLSETRHFDVARELVRFMSSEPLRLHAFTHLEFGTCDTRWEDQQLDARRFYGTLRQCLDHESLQRLQVTTGRAVNVDSARLFSALRVFKNVSIAVVYVNHEGADLDNALDILTAAWPSLTQLRFVNRGAMELYEPSPRMTQVSLEGLIPLATRCPALKLLGLPLDTCRPVPKHIHLLEHQVLRGRQIELDVRAARPPRKQEDIDLLVNFLASVFPAQTLRSIRASGDWESLQDEWREICDKVRELCRKRM
ncbi:hypothetical protein BD626DRAFT_255923 [Schizophyllum amplum]|uniref:F-box domain-containing protein n=1 Tax=Schizophyllum amplum TaxID=97359 RepID=A0A550CIL6_9AGAR|nr:hypothetical protein BD626DRAFT_255923 [Auriculariopsis ampla]